MENGPFETFQSICIIGIIKTIGVNETDPKLQGCKCKFLQLKSPSQYALCFLVFWLLPAFVFEFLSYLLHKGLHHFY